MQSKGRGQGIIAVFFEVASISLVSVFFVFFMAHGLVSLDSSHLLFLCIGFCYVVYHDSEVNFGR